MSKTRKREMKHILANFSLRKKASAYRIDTDSLRIEAIYELLKNKMIKCAKIVGPFLYVVPTKLSLHSDI